MGKRRFTVIGSGSPQNTFLYENDQPAKDVKEFVFRTGYEGTTVEVISYKRNGSGDFIKAENGELETTSVIYSDKDTEFEAKIDPLFPFLAQVDVPQEDKLAHIVQMLKVYMNSGRITQEEVCEALGWRAVYANEGAIREVAAYSKGWDEAKHEQP